MTICTIDVHSRDVVGKLISSKIESVLAFMWQSQLRHRSKELHTNYMKSTVVGNDLGY